MLAVFAALFNGTFSSIQKHPRIALLNPQPQLLSGYVCLGASLSCFCILPFLSLLDAKLKFNPLGMLSGCLFVGAVCFTFLAIPRLGLAMASSVWSGCALITAFAWGVAGPSPVGSTPKSWAGSVLAVVLLLMGILGIVFHEQIATRVCGASKGEQELVKNSTDFQDASVTDDDLAKVLEACQPLLAQTPKDSSHVVGLCLAFLSGVLGGSVNVPSTMSQRYGTALNGVETLLSFGIGTFLSNGLLMITFFVMPKARDQTNGIACRSLLLPGIISGSMWIIGNVCSIYAKTGISVAVAQPLLQCSLLFSGMLGIFVFKEIAGVARISAFFVSALLLLSGTLLFGVFGPKG